MRLLTIDNINESKAITNTVLSGLFPFTGSTKEGWWIGLNDIGSKIKNASKRRFYWTGTELQTTFTDWAPGQPNNFGGNQRCVELMGCKANFQWSDEVCAKSRRFICSPIDSSC